MHKIMMKRFRSATLALAAGFLIPSSIFAEPQEGNVSGQPSDTAICQ